MINQAQYAFAVLLFLGGICISVPASADLCDQDPDCDRITVHGTSMAQMLAMGLSPAYAENEGQADEIGMDDVITLFARIIQHDPNRGDQTVNCSSIDVIRQAYASNQMGPHLGTPPGMPGYISNGQPVRVTYGNDQDEIFVVTNRMSTIPAEPIPGTCS